MSEFVVNTDLFGRYANIPTNHSGRKFIYKIVSLYKSNCYCDVPILYNSEPTLHKDIVPVLNVICCGVDESKVIRVALKDCEIQKASGKTYTMNDDLYFKLTDVGKRIWEEEIERIKTLLPGHDWQIPYVEDEWVKEQLWELFKLFGKHVNNGFDLCITDLTFEKPIKEKQNEGSN